MRLMVVIALVINVFLALSLIFFQATRKTYPGFGLWTTGVSLLGLGYLSLCLRGYIPDSMSILLVNAAFPLGMVLHLAGMRRFLGLTPMSRLWYALPWGVVAAAAVFYYGYDLEAWRSLILSIAISVPHFVMAFLILRHPVRPSSMFYSVIASLLALAGVMILGKGIWSLSEPQFHILLHSPVQFIFFVAVLVLQLGETLAFIMLNAERVESELVESEAELRTAVASLQDSLAGQKLVEEFLRESEERYRTFFDTSRDCVFMTRLDGQFIDFNDVALEVLGYAPDGRNELLQTNVANVYANPEERKAHAALVLKQGYAKEFPVDLRKKDGAFIHTLITTIARRDPQGTIIGFQGTVRDITERRRAEEVLQTTLQRFYTILSSMYAGVLLVTDEGLVEFANQAFCDLFDLDDLPSELRGLAPPEMIKKIQDVYAHPAEAVGRIQAIVAQQRPVKGEEIAIRGGRAYLRDFIPLLIDGKRYGRLWHHQDITDRKRAEQKLMESEERFRLSAESLSDVIYEWDLGSSIKWFGNIDGLLGYAPGKFPHTLEAWIGILHPDDRDRVWKAVEKQLSDEATYDIEYRVQHKEGGWRYWVARGKVLKDASGKPLRWIGAVTDITERKRVEELALQSARLRAVADLSSGVAHHFNNLLQIVMASTSLSLADLESGDLSEIKTNLQKMLQAATLGAETVKRLQTFANIRTDVTERESDVFDLANTARNAAEVSKPLWKSDTEKKGVKIDLQLNLEDGCLVKGQENEMFEVLVNLIRNAAEAMPQGGDIEVKTYREADEVVIAVRDTGTGIAEEDLSKVFQPFWSSKGVGIGKGMGLAVTHGLVKRHGGSISVDSNVGAGTTFTIRLPLAQEQVAKLEQLSIGTSGDHLTILVIDDDVNIASLLERICAKEGHTVFRALSGQEGLAIFNTESVDLVISDLGMPGMNGWDVGKSIRSICQERGVSKPPFILLTGYGGQELEKERIADSGVDAVVAKPIDRATVLATVQEIAGRLNIQPRVT